jgi:DNA end-binding protein Ku
LPRGKQPKAEKPASSVVGRPVWSGSISFGLVTVPVELVTAQRRTGLPIRTFSPDGNFLKRQLFCPKDEAVLSGDDLERGYEVEKDEFVAITDEEIEGLAPRSSRDIDLSQFVPRDAIDPAYFVKSYFVLPSGDQAKAYRLLAETMEKTDRAAVARFVMRGKGYALALFAERGILRAETLRFHDEVRDPANLELTSPVKVEASRVKRMQTAIRELAAAAVKEEDLDSDDSERIEALAREKLRKGQDVVQVSESVVRDEGGESFGEVIDLVAALKERLGQKREPARATRTPKREAKAKTRARGPARTTTRRRAASRS